MPKIPPELKEQRYQLFNESCFETFKRINNKSVDLVLCDPPYGTTQNKWDSVIPLEPMWRELRRIAKGCICLCGSQPFTSVLITSCLPWFKYCWIWDKVNRLSGHLNSKKQPLRITEDIVVFYENQPTYNPQMTEGIPYKATSKGRKSNNYGSQIDGVTTINKGERFPRNLITIKADERGSEGRIHPTQKPVALMEYLIKTYTNENDLVLDFAMGSGTTGVACGNLNRRFIGCDNDTEHGYFEIAERRISEAYKRS